jgi:hypothetical protein
MITDTLALLLEIKSKIDNGYDIYCIWSATSHNPNTASLRYIDKFYNVDIKAKIHNFNIPYLPEISLDDIHQLEIYIIDNYEALNRIEKLYAFS